LGAYFIAAHLLCELACKAMKIETALGSVRLTQATLDSSMNSLRSARHLWLRRLAFWGPIGTATALGAVLATIATSAVHSPLRWPLLALLVVNLFYIALTGTPGVIGFALHLTRRRLRAVAQSTGRTRTAVLMPVHKEDPQAVFAAIEVMARAIHDADVRNVELFVLSDTQDAAIAAEEQAAYDALIARAPFGPGVHYRRRPSNEGRKAGNVAEFCDRWGDAYDYMLVLDADSLMGASAISGLIGLMDANPRTGIIQTVPYPVGRETLFARLQQFSARLYTPLLVEGLTFWQQGDGNYWGHNAIIRIAPFRAHCTLPVLPGAEPWGGEILCHDVVEAGLMRGAGWDVWVLPEVLESYEAVPANLVDFASRERRWCQGNLQHSGVLKLPGFRPVGRFHMAYGIAHYLAGPAALLFLLLSTVDAVLGGGVARALMTGGAAAAGLVGLGAVLLYAGKITSLVAALADGNEARKYGGRLALLGSAVLEQAAACVISAMLIVYYSGYVLDLIRGRTVRWDAQPRDDRGVGWAEGWLRMRAPAIVGLVWLGALPLLPHGLLGWTLPLLGGLLAAYPLTILSSRTTLGAAARRMNLLLTPEEATPPAIVHAYQRAMLTRTAPSHAAPAVCQLELLAQTGDGN
jgi:membrane glycosyltransferase